VPERSASPGDQRHPPARLVDENTAVACQHPPGATGAHALSSPQVRHPVSERCRHRESSKGYRWRRPSQSFPLSIQDHC